MSKNSVRLRIFKNNTAAIVFDNDKSKVNTLGKQTLKELDHILDDLQKNKNIKLLTIQSIKEDVFIAGADIKEIQNLNEETEALEKVKFGQAVLNKIEKLKFPTIAIINGVCLGGGAELALCCDYRIATDNPKTKIGFPEVHLGIFPGFGGTQRLPKLIGLINALPMILTGKPMDAKQAFKKGLVDAYVAESFLASKIREFSEKVLNKKVKRKKHLLQHRFMQSLWLRYFIYYKAKKDILKKTKGLYPAPLKALEVIQKTYRWMPLKKGLDKEAQEFAKLAVSNTCKNLIHVFYGQELLKKEAKEKAKYADGAIKSATIVGAGIMGGDIAWLFSKIDIPVRLIDLKWEAITAAVNHAKNLYKKLVRKKKVTASESQRKISLISGTTEQYPLKQQDFILEAVIEDMAIKQKIFKDLEKKTKKRTIFATNTSALSVTKMGSVLKNPGQILGFHFFNPATKMPLVEIIPTPKTSKETLGTTFKIALDMGKLPVEVKDHPGFLVNRLLMAYRNEAAHMFDEGVSIEKIDHVLEKFGMPMGPFKLADAVGVDIGHKVSKELNAAYGNLMKPAKILREMVDQGLLGKKTKKGFYDYTNNTMKIASAVNRLKPKSRDISEKDILNRCLLIMVNEAARCLEEKIIQSPAHLDIAMILGTGFPAFRGGLLKYADDRGLDIIMKKLMELTKQYNTRFDPIPLICDLGEKNKTFYGSF
jgi:3-hydroxyacyl-CoA dehydrogenase/enoyl-CoA hydratase/3-hydroxybutyryl-CoA epimerase